VAYLLLLRLCHTIIPDQNIHDLIENRHCFKLISSFPVHICLIKFLDQRRQFLICCLLLPPETNESLRCKIVLKLFQRDLQNHCLVLLRCMDRMDLIGIDNDLFSCLQRVFFFIYKKIQASGQNRKNFDGSMPVLFPHIISISPFKQKHLKRKSFIRNDQFMLKFQTSHLSSVK